MNETQPENPIPAPTMISCPEQVAADAINQRAAMTDAEWEKSLWKTVTLPPDYKPSTPEELEGEQAVNKLIDMAYDHLREEAEEALRLNPQDSDAISKLAIANQHAYLRKNPKAKLVAVDKRIIRRMNPRTDRRKFATWVRTTVGWALRCPKGEMGDTVHVCMKGGTTKPMRLIERLDHRTFRGVDAEG